MHLRISRGGLRRWTPSTPRRSTFNSATGQRLMATAAELDHQSRYSMPNGFFSRDLAESDPAVRDAIRAELHREQTQIELIASENIVSKAVLEAQGSVLTNKYAEGYPGRRYYQGCAPSDTVESLAIERAKKLFSCQYANVQPHSGAQA